MRETNPSVWLKKRRNMTIVVWLDRWSKGEREREGIKGINWTDEEKKAK